MKRRKQAPMADVLKSLEELEKVAPPRQSPGFLVSVYASAAVMVFLCLLYAALVIGAGWIAADYLISHILVLGRSSDTFLNILYIGIGALGFLLVALIIKPAFSLRRDEVVTRRITPKDEPAFFGYVHRLCAVLQAPPPEEVHVSLFTDAMVRFSSIGSSLTGDRPQLHLGLSLISGASLRTVTAVLTHEMGHLRQRFGLPVHQLIHLINNWFLHVVYDRDRFDYWLWRLSRPEMSLLCLPFHAARGIVWLGRGLLWVFMRLAQISSCYISRRCEYDADRCSAHVVGAEGVARALQSSTILDIAAEGTYRELPALWQQRRLPDDFPALVARRAIRIPREQHESLKGFFNSERTRWFWTHPSVTDRIAAVQGACATGAFTGKQPAAALLTGFGRLCHDMTVEMYRSVLGDELDEGQLVSTKQIAADLAAQDRASQSTERFYQQTVTVTWAVQPAAPETLPDDLPKLVNQLQKARFDMKKSAEDARNLLAEALVLEDHLVRGRQVEMLCLRDVPIHPPNVAAVTAVNQMAQERRRIESRLWHIREWMDDYYARVGTRLGCAIALLDHKALQSRLTPEKLQQLRRTGDTIRTIWPVLDAAEEAIRGMSLHQGALVALLQSFDMNTAGGAVMAAACELADNLAPHLDRLREVTADTPYPFEHGQGTVTVADYLCPAKIKIPDPGRAAAQVGEVLNRYDLLVVKLLAAQAEMAEKAEDTIGLQRQEAPPPSTLADNVDARIAAEVAPDPAARDTTSSALPQLALALCAVLLGALGTWIGATVGSFSANCLTPKHPAYEPTITPSNWSSSGGPEILNVPGVNPNSVRRHVPWSTGPQAPKLPSYNRPMPSQPHMPGRPRIGGHSPTNRRSAGRHYPNPHMRSNQPSTRPSWQRAHPTGRTPGSHRGSSPGSPSHSAHNAHPAGAP